MHADALTQEAALILPKFSRVKSFYLVGGTALALQIGHRLSVDFDFFSEEPLPKNLLSRVKRIFAPLPLAVTYRAPEQINLTIHGVKTTFFHYEYPVVDTLVSYKGISLASIREVAAMKAFAIGKRLAYKDYIDWYFLLKDKHVTLQEVIDHAAKKYDGDFNDRLFLGQLVSFEDVETQKIDFLRGEISRGEIEGFLKNEVREFVG